MPETHPPYPPQYWRRIVELARAGRRVNELAREFEPSASAIRYLLRQAGLDEGLHSDGLTSDERAELKRPSHENRVLHEEREALAKAAAWSATGDRYRARHRVPNS
jgi:transposase